MITYRKAALQDIPEILGCLRGVYGDHSYYSSYYDPAYLREIIDNIFTADADGEVVGTLVLSPWGCDGNDRELGAFLVRSDVRKSNIGTGLLAYTLDAISGLPSVKGVPITYNTGSQSIVGELGFIPSGMLFGTIDMNLLTAGKAESAEKKPLILVVRNFNVTDIGEIYVPPPL
ncbi:MAG: GNAT family N-acetyltransferase, partial [Clostridiales Family XIII bacterium]|nr:GNAT family N-acetyltransferase [Clostridiales Family XIII bacterium]